jgi:hypothetical protein
MRNIVVLFVLALAAQYIAAAASTHRDGQHRSLLRGRARARSAIKRVADPESRSIGRMGLAANPKVETHLRSRQAAVPVKSKTFKASEHVIGLESARRGDVVGIHPLLYLQQHAVLKQSLLRSIYG